MGDRRWSVVDGRWALVALVLACVSVSAHQYTFEQVASGLTDRDAETRLRAIQILRDADYAEAAVPIAATLADKDDRVQLAALDAERALFTTAQASRRRKIGFVIEVRSGSGASATADAQLALKPRTVPREVLGGLAAALLDDSMRVRAEAISLTALLGPVACAGGVQASAGGVRLQPDELCAGVGNALIENINTREPGLRRAAMQALGRLRYPNAAQALSDQLSYHQRGPDAVAALAGLAGIGHPTSISIFQQMLSDSNATMRQLAVEGLANAGAVETLPELQRLGQNERSNDVLLALHYANVALGASPASFQELVAALRVPAQQSAALGYLLAVAPTHAGALAGSLQDGSAEVRRLVADVLGFSRDRAAIPALEAASKDPQSDVAQAAQQAIARLKL